jgi:tetratricopeptide (TPR) repeat protein
MREYEATISFDQTKAEPFLKLGAMYVEKGLDEEKIMDVYEKGLILDPNHAQIQYDLALLYVKHKNYDKATEHYGKANELLPDNFQWHYEYARLLDGRDNGKAVEEYTRTIELKRDFAPAYYDRAMLLRRAKIIDGKVYRNAQILEDFKQAVELAPGLADAFFNMALLYREMDLDEMAKDRFEKALEVKPDYLEAHLQLGLIAERKEEYAKAMEEYRAEIKLNDNSALAHQRLGFLYSNYSLELAKAAEELEKASELDPDNIETILYYGNVLYNMTKFGQSADQFERVIQLDPKNPTANYNLGLVYEAWDKKELAIQQWQRFLEMDPPGSWAEEAKQRLRKLGVE